MKPRCAFELCVIPRANGRETLGFALGEVDEDAGRRSSPGWQVGRAGDDVSLGSGLGQACGVRVHARSERA